MIYNHLFSYARLWDACTVGAEVFEDSFIFINGVILRVMVTNCSDRDTSTNVIEYLCVVGWQVTHFPGMFNWVF